MAFWSAALPAIASFGGNLIGGLLGSKSQEETNQQNRELTEDTRAWEERMSNTAYQRARADMEKAGLNPILTASRGGADTPSVASAHMENPGKFYAEAGNSASSNALNVATLRQQIATSKSQEEVNNAQKSLLQEQALKTKFDAGSQAIDNKVKAFEARNKIETQLIRSSRPNWLKAWGQSLSDSLNTINPLKGLFK